MSASNSAENILRHTTTIPWLDFDIQTRLQSGNLTEIEGGLALRIAHDALDPTAFGTTLWLLNKSTPPLKSLSWVHVTGSQKHHIDAVGEILKTNTDLVELNLEPHVAELNVIRAGIESRGDMIAEGLKTNSTLTSLMFYGQGMRTTGASLFAEAFRTNQSLTKIDLGCNPIGGEGFQLIAESLQHHPVINSLKLDNIFGESFTEVQYGSITKLMSVNSSLTELTLNRSNLPSGAFLGIAQALSVNTSLLRLECWANTTIGDETGAAIVEALIHNSTLRSLDLSYTEINNPIIVEIARALPFNTTLTELKLRASSGRYATPSGPTNVYDNFVEYLAVNGSICALDLGLIIGEQHYPLQMMDISALTSRNRSNKIMHGTTLFELIWDLHMNDLSLP